jgi:hypothetical protein
VADEQQVLNIAVVFDEFVEVFEGAGGGEGVGVEDLGFVAGLVGNEGGGLEAALEWAGDDEIEVDVEGIEDVGELEAVALTLFVEGTFDVENRVGTGCAGARVPEDKEVHKTPTVYCKRVSGWFGGVARLN